MNSSSSTAVSILLLEGDAEAALLADAQSVIDAVLPGREVRLLRAWATRPDWLDAAAPEPPASLRRQGAIPDVDPRELLAQPHRLVIFALLPAVVVPALRHRAGGVFLAHRGVREHWSPEVAAFVAAECIEEPPLAPDDAAAALEPVIELLQEQGSAVAVCTSFRHVRQPLDHRCREGTTPLRELIRHTNLEAARLSQRTGCFVFDVDRPLAEIGGASLKADCFGGTGRAAELALDEFAALVLDALPEDALLENA